jgi:hypothetical protein
LAGLQRGIEHAAAQSAAPGNRLNQGHETMQRTCLVIGLAVASSFITQGCAKSSAPAPFRLGMPIVADAALANEETNSLPPNSQSDTRPELRHIASNKVLGAMAFQKTTGRAVDPDRLTGGQ